jgi:uncharacterized protein (DUF2236 family)
MDSFPLTHRLFVGELSDDEVERYYREAAGLEPLLGIPVGSLPRSRAELDSYLRHMTESGAIRVGVDARRIARDLLNPALPWQMGRVLWPVLWVSRLPTIGLLPPEIRAQYGFRWTPAHALGLRLLSLAARCVVPLMPGLLRHWPIARRAAARTAVGSEATPEAAAPEAVPT